MEKLSDIQLAYAVAILDTIGSSSMLSQDFYSKYSQTFINWLEKNNLLMSTTLTVEGRIVENRVVLCRKALDIMNNNFSFKFNFLKEINEQG